MKDAKGHGSAAHQNGVNEIPGAFGLTAPFLRQAIKLRNSSDPKLRSEMRAEIRNSIRVIRSNRARGFL